ncbi:Methyltransferase domain-containing protein [Methylomagnum ishizawai]|uniref:Methyltransferase domain-containing protein n=1 Tax=Methylomagnum ishizawai TaxID=1760988 RepID=A0A1Y6CRQ4_9GAMM|nr:class I SAM-dependent methyltransferase [Methylomagnum ishizawai]SMF93308.1 Methyltransferase domain-containing protein [Methylomagnum ishizawai]
MTARHLSELVATAAARYRPAGRFAWHFAQGKLAGDPVFAGLLARGLIADHADILDLGCGQGLLAAWLQAARERHGCGAWPDAWPPPPRIRAYRGIELMPADAHRARTTLGADADIVTGDIRAADLGTPDTVVILDVLHFIGHADQAALLARIHAALTPGGTLLLRIGDAAGGAKFGFGLWVDRWVAFVRGHGLARLHCRTLRDWVALLERLGFAVEVLPMAQGTPFANQLLIARKPTAATTGPAAGA